MLTYKPWTILIFCARAKCIALAQAENAYQPLSTVDVIPINGPSQDLEMPNITYAPLLLEAANPHSVPPQLASITGISPPIPLSVDPPVDPAALANFLSSNTILGLAIDPYIKNSARSITEVQLQALIRSLSGVISNPIDIRGLLGTGLKILYSTLGIINNMIDEFFYSSAVLENIRMRLRAVLAGSSAGAGGDGTVQALLDSVQGIEQSLLGDLIRKGSLALLLGAMMMPLPVS